jgi:hypothetical protein
MFLRRLKAVVKPFLLLVLGAILLAPEWPAFGDELHRLNAIVGPRKFDFLVWELEAAGVKAEAILSAGHDFVDAGERKEIVLNYLDQVKVISELERGMRNIYTDPNLPDPDAASVDLQMSLRESRDVFRQLQPVAEAIVQDQVAHLLVDEGFELLGQAWPPVMMRMSPLPSILIVSPRDRIDRIYGIPLVAGLDTSTREALENSVLRDLDLSALVVNIGGLGTYPAMIVETSNINRLAEVTAHEWAHHWLAPYPITFNYLTDAQIRTINETVASIVGTEIGSMMIERYYPEFVPQEPLEEAPAETVEEDEFDFRAEMAKTRIRTDELLAEGKIEQAEAYMEQRRQFLLENGYRIRKINQAFFAFHGAYADQPGEAGDDPIGPMLLAIREQSPSLRKFLETMATVREFEDLQSILASGKS